MPSYAAPGVYIEEVSTGPRPIEAVGTSTAAFLGVAPADDRRPHQAVAVDNWMQFVREFTADGAASTPLAQAVRGFFDNGGRRCYVVNVGRAGTIAGAIAHGQRRGVAVLEEVDEVAIVAAPGYTDRASYEEVLSHCERMKDRVAILDAPAAVDDVALLTREAVQPAAGATPAAAAADEGAAGLRPPRSDGGYGAFYFPWITVRDALDPEKLVDVPPSGHLAGIYARTDATRGVHKAPANERVVGALNVTYRVTRQEQELLNPEGVNCIRFFPDAGIRVWGGRTLAAAASEWRYVNVRRLFNMAEKSIGRATSWTVFEPNDVTLWKSIRRDIGAFLTRLWRSGALMGTRPEEAFFVKCDAETNPPEEVDAGRVVTLVGIAPVKPAEFIVFRIGQHAGGTTIDAEGATHG